MLQFHSIYLRLNRLRVNVNLARLCRANLVELICLIPVATITQRIA